MNEVKLDENKLQEMAEKYAYEGAEKAIRDFYSGYDSPFMKKVQKEMEEKLETNYFFKLPNLTAAINEAINNKVTEMANAVVANTYLPMLNNMFTGVDDKEVTTQDLFDCFGKTIQDDDLNFDPDELEIRIEKGAYICYHVSFVYRDEVYYMISLCETNDKHGLYNITGLPDRRKSIVYDPQKQMRIVLKNGHKIEMPFTPDVLRDSFMQYIAKLLLNNSLVKISKYHEYEETD